MKNLILTLALTLSTNAIAADAPYFTLGKPTFIVKAFANPTSDVKTKGAILEVETGACDNYKFCYNPIVATVEGSVGLGGDITYKIAKNKARHAFKFSAGVVAFDEAFNGESKNVIHLAAAVEIYTSKNYGFLITVDNFQTDKPVTMFGLGFHFR